MPKILDGAAIAAQIKQEVAEEVKRLSAQGSSPRPRRSACGPRARL